MEHVGNYIEMPTDINQDHAKKVFLTMGVNGGLRIGELKELKWGDIEENIEGLDVTIRKSKSDQVRSMFSSCFFVPNY